MPGWWFLPVLGAFILSAILTDVVRVIGLRFGFVDVANSERKKHAGVIPRLGGTAIYLAFGAMTLAVLFLTDHLTSGDITSRQLIGFLLGGLILMIGGALDDKFDLPPKVTMTFPVLAALVAIVAGLGVAKVTNPLGGAFTITENISDIITFIWLIVMMYTTKLLDGLDGLATGVGSIGALMIALLALSVKFFQPDVALLSLVALAAMLGFLAWNFHPAKIFLGEGGSTLIGYLIAGLAVISGSKMATALLVLGVPAFDIIFVMSERFRSGRSIFKGDRAHLHHRLFDLGFSQRQVVALYYGASFVFGITTLIFQSWQKLVALGVLFVIMLIVLIILGRRGRVPRPCDDEKYEV